MKLYRLALIKKEFPFVDGVFSALHSDYSNYSEMDLGIIDSIKIQKGDKNLLMKTGNEDSYSWSNGGHHNYTKYFAIVSEEIIKLESSGWSATGSGDNNEWKADTIGEQLFAKNIIPDFVVECIYNDTDDNGNGQATRFWTIFKMKRFDLGSYHQEKIDEAAAIIKAEIAAACA